MIECAVIRDLLPLYADNVLSEASIVLVSGHLAACEDCEKELLNMQSEIKKSHPDDEPKINALKSMKTKISRQKVVVAAIASALAVAVAIGGFWFVFHNERPMKYEEGLVRVEKRAAKVIGVTDGLTIGSAVVLDLISTKDYYSSYATRRIININGVNMEIVYVSLSETLSTKWWPKNSDGQNIRFAGVGTDDYSLVIYQDNPLIMAEVYYFDTAIADIAFMSEEDFYAQRVNGVLLWNGKLE